VFASPSSQTWCVVTAVIAEDKGKTLASTSYS
jgi:hypothetical protein